MSGVLKALVVVFLFIIELVVDILCCALFVCALVAFWRIPFWPGEIRLGSRNKFRESAVYAFATSLCDLITLPFFGRKLGIPRTYLSVSMRVGRG
jgi:Na+/serine symporter